MIDHGGTVQRPALEVGLDTSAAPQRLWEVLIDTHQWPVWGPSVREVVSADRYIGAGSTGWVVVIGVGVRVGFRITAFEPGRRWCWSVARLPATGHRVDPLPGGGGRVVFELPRWAFAYTPVCRAACRRIVRMAQEE
ncbi:SRPBCC family protein [Halorhodospira halophila]|uniref:SRPBCC family protein n=1 Tax=Halorhodospira halophila TaxID=1053 RepID=UPI0002D271B8|nr:SRPBCC family protein [Halorhodospira halophila]